MLPRLSRFLTCHNDVIDAEQNNRLFAPGTNMDRERLRLSQMQKDTYYVQICDKTLDIRSNMFREVTLHILSIGNFLLPVTYIIYLQMNQPQRHLLYKHHQVL